MFVVRLCAAVQLEGIIYATTLGAVYTQFGLASWFAKLVCTERGFCR